MLVYKIHFNTAKIRNYDLIQEFWDQTFLVLLIFCIFHIVLNFQSQKFQFQKPYFRKVTAFLQEIAVCVFLSKQWESYARVDAKHTINFKRPKDVFNLHWKSLIRPVCGLQRIKVSYLYCGNQREFDAAQMRHLRPLLAKSYLLTLSIFRHHPPTCLVEEGFVPNNRQVNVTLLQILLPIQI